MSRKHKNGVNSMNRLNGNGQGPPASQQISAANDFKLDLEPTEPAVTNEQCQQLVNNAGAAADQLLAVSNINVARMTVDQREQVTLALTNLLCKKFNVGLDVRQQVMFVAKK